ncbi:hypothetical protein U1Q18_002010 [Sarracenia purpurea var. burkii]
MSEGDWCSSKIFDISLPPFSSSASPAFDVAAILSHLRRNCIDVVSHRRHHQSPLRCHPSTASSCATDVVTINVISPSTFATAATLPSPPTPLV